MANKEIIIIILITIIIGISVVVAINVVKEHDGESNKDAIRQEMLVAASNAQSYFTRPAGMGGGSGSFIDVNHGHLGVEANGINGDYYIEDRTVSSFTLRAITKNGEDEIIATITKSGLTWVQL